MKTKLLLSLLCIFVLTAFYNVCTLAAESYDTTTDIDGMSGVIRLSLGSHYVYDSNPATEEEVWIVCDNNTNLTIKDVNIDVSSVDDVCPVHFVGGQNILTLKGENILNSAFYQPGIKVEGTTVLTIDGEGILKAIAGPGAAGIGSGFYDLPTSSAVKTSIETPQINNILFESRKTDVEYNIEKLSINPLIERHEVGTIIIESGDIYAVSLGGGAGIGGGAQSKGGTVIINGGDVKAMCLGYGGAGIGCGVDSASTIDIIITGGKVKGYGGYYSSGIGGGDYCGFGEIKITGGEVAGYGGSDNEDEGETASGIGSGAAAEHGGVIKITGGTVLGVAGEDSGMNTNDIGNGDNAEANTMLSIGGDAGVFLWNGYLTAPSTSHNLEPGVYLANDLDMVNEVYELNADDEWKDSAKGYFVLKDHTKDMHGSITGTVYDSDGNLLEDYRVILYSKPKVQSTDADGRFVFGKVPYTDHYIYIKDETGKEINSFYLDFEKGDKAKFNMSPNTNTGEITYTKDTSNIDFAIRINGAKTNFDITDVEFTGAANPDTGEKNRNISVFIITFLSALFIIFYLCNKFIIFFLKQRI